MNAVNRLAKILGMQEQDGMDDQALGNGEEGDEMPSLENKVYLPIGVAEDAEPGDDFEGTVKGKIVDVDGFLYVQVDTLDDEVVKTADEVEAEEGGGNGDY